MLPWFLTNSRANANSLEQTDTCAPIPGMRNHGIKCVVILPKKNAKADQTCDAVYAALELISCSARIFVGEDKRRVTAVPAHCKSDL